MIRNSVKDGQSRIAWQTVNEVSSRKSTVKAKLKAASQEEWIHLWKEHFKNLLGKSPKVTDEPITKIISYKLDIKLVVLRKIKNSKVAGVDEITPRGMENKKIWWRTAPILQCRM